MDNNKCKHCDIPLIVKQTRNTPGQLLKQYYYTAYYFCPRCKRMYLDDKFKVINENYDLFSGQHDVNGGPVDIEIWTDGACVNNGKDNAKAAWGFVSGTYEKAGIVDGKQTNNRAEAQAIFEALKWAAEKDYKRVKINTDTQITIHSLNKPLSKIKANTDIFGKIFHLLKHYHMDVIYQKVAGHSGIEQNERVDKLANDYATRL